MSEAPICHKPRIGRHEQGKRLSLHITKLTCIDETEHEGIWPVEGEGIANDAIRLTCAVTTRIGVEAEPSQCRTETMNLGDNYQDSRSFVLDREVAALFIPEGSPYPVTMNVIFLLGEEDWGGENWDREVKEVVRVAGVAASRGVASLTAAGVGGAIGTALGPVGAAVGAAVGAIVGAIVDGLTSAIHALESDIFTPQDLSLVLHSPEASFAGAAPDRLTGHLDFQGHGGQYRLTYEWRLDQVTSHLGRPSGSIPLDLYWSAARGDNFTTATDIGKRDAAAAGYRFARTEGYVYPTARAGTAALNLFWSAARGDNFTTGTATGRRDAEAAGYTFVRAEGYGFSTQRAGTVPLRLYWKDGSADNFITASDAGRRDAEAAGYRFVRIEGYIFPQAIALRVHNNQFIGVAGGGGSTVDANRPWNREHETFEVVYLGGNSIALRTYLGYYLCAEGGGGRELVANRTWVGDWEKFELVHREGSRVALRVANGQYVCAEGGGGREVVANRSAIGIWETFEIIAM